MRWTYLLSVFAMVLMFTACGFEQKDQSLTTQTGNNDPRTRIPHIPEADVLAGDTATTPATDVGQTQTDVSVGDDVAAQDDVQIGDDVTATNDVQVGDDVTATNDVQAGDDVAVTDDVQVDDDVTATDDVQVGDDVAVTDDVQTSEDVFEPECTNNAHCAHLSDSCNLGVCNAAYECEREPVASYRKCHETAEMYCFDGACLMVDCDDNDFCTTDYFSRSAGICRHDARVGCCHHDTDCVDGDSRTVDWCVTGECVNYVPPAGCQSNMDCDDGDSCTTDRCVDNACESVDNGTCECGTNDDCYYEEVCECNSEHYVACQHEVCQNNQCVSVMSGDMEYCQYGCQAGACVNEPPCSNNSQCNDGNACTEDLCVAGLCSNVPLEDCCDNDDDCTDSDFCTADTCDAGICRNVQMERCACVQHDDCTDNDPCTLDECTNNFCVTRFVCAEGEVCQSLSDTEFNCYVPQLCDSASDCDDENACTFDLCLSGECAHLPMADCVACETDEACEYGDMFCSNGLNNVLLVNMGDCRNGSCHLIEVPCNGWCEDDACQNPDCEGDNECDDADPCTEDSCFGGYCVYVDQLGCLECNSDYDCMPAGRRCASDGVTVVQYAAVCDQHVCAYTVREECEFGCEEGQCREAGECVMDSDCVSANHCDIGTCNSGQCEWDRVEDCRSCNYNSDCDSSEEFCSTQLLNVMYENTGECESGFCWLNHVDCPGGCQDGVCSVASGSCSSDDDCPGLFRCLESGTCGYDDDYIVCSIDCNHDEYENFVPYVWYGWDETRDRIFDRMLGANEKFAFPKEELCYWQSNHPTFDLNCRNPNNDMWNHGIQAVIECSHGNVAVTPHVDGQGKATVQVMSVLCNE